MMFKKGRGEDKCWAALERLAGGIPNNPANAGATITRALVSKEAGFDSGYIKPGRHPELCEAIEAASLKQRNRKSTVPVRDLERAKGRADDAIAHCELYKARLDAALSRELVLIKRIRQLELELAEQGNGDRVSK